MGTPDYETLSTFLPEIIAESSENYRNALFSELVNYVNVERELKGRYRLW